MQFLTAAAFLCLVSCALASGVVAPYGAAIHAPLAVGGVAHYATVPVGRAVAYGSTINHGTVSGVGLAPYGYRYGLGLATPAVAAAPLATTHVSTVKYGLAAPAAPLPVSYGLAAPVAAAPVAAVSYGVAAAPVAAVKYGVAAPVALPPGYGLNKGYAH